jgi:hypothetical protein
MADENDINDRLERIDATLGKYENSAVAHTEAYINVLRKRAAGEKVTNADLAALSTEIKRTTAAMKQMKQDFYAAGASAVGLASSFGKGKDSFELFNDAIDIAVKATKGAFGALSAVMAKLNPIAGKVAGIVGELGQGVAEIAGDIGKYLVNTFAEGYKTFTNLSKVGAIGADGIVGMARQFESLGLNMSRFQQLVASNSNTLAMLGSTVSDSANTMVDGISQMRMDGTYQQLRNLGFSAEEVGDSMIAYAELQRVMGQNAFNDQVKLAQGTMAYSKELDTIARLTGKSREETQKALQAQMRETRFRNKIQSMMAQGQVQAAEELQRAVLVQQQMGNTQIAKAIMDASTGIYNSPEAISAVTSMRGFAQNVQGLTQGMKESDFTQNLQNASKETVKNFNMLGQAVGDASVVTRLNTEQNNLATAKQGKYAEARAKAEEQLTKGMTQTNKQTADLTQAAMNLEQAAATMQATFMQTETMPALMKEASIAMKEGVNVLADAIKSFRNNSTYTSPGANTPPMSAEQQAAQTNKLQEANEKLEKNNNLNAEQVQLLKEISNPPKTLAPGEKPGYSPENPEPGLSTMFLGPKEQTDNTPRQAADKTLGYIRQTTGVTPAQTTSNDMPPVPVEIKTPTGPSMQAPANQTPEASTMLPPKQEMPASSNEPQGAMNINGMNELIAASNMQGQKLDRIEAALKKGNSISANS